MPTYSSTADLLTGNIPVSAPTATKYVQDAADEIDSVLGQLYVTPINVAEDGPVLRHSRLLLKRISNWLASGRLMLATSAGGEDDQMHAYAKYLVDSATTALMAVASGEVTLDGAERDDDASESGLPGPVISNVDPESNVEAFYDRIYNQDPAYVLPLRWAGG